MFKYNNITELVNIIKMHQTKLRIFKDAYENTRKQIIRDMNSYDLAELKRMTENFFIKEEAYRNKVVEVDGLIKKNLTDELIKLGKSETVTENGEKVILTETSVAEIID